MARRDLTFEHGLVGVATFFFFLGWVVFEGFKIELPTGSVSPFVIIGFLFALSATIYFFRKSIRSFFRNI